MKSMKCSQQSVTKYLEIPYLAVLESVAEEFQSQVRHRTGVRRVTIERVPTSPSLAIATTWPLSRFRSFEFVCALTG